MKIFNYNGKQYQVEQKAYLYIDIVLECLHIQTDDYKCFIEGVSLEDITDDSDFAILMKNEYLIVGEDYEELLHKII